MEHHDFRCTPTKELVPTASANEVIGVRIAVIGPPWVPVPPPAYGGTEAVLEGLLLGLAAKGHDVAYAGHPESTVDVPLLPGVEPDGLGPIGDTPS